MDVHCSTCNERWDTFHLSKDAIFETELSVEEAQAWLGLSSAYRLADRYRDAFRAAGWEFGRSIMNVIRCPCYRKDAKPNPERVQTKAALEALLGGDEDGLALTFGDYKL